jgi:NADH-quinone oxidoreductase subunit C
MAVQQNNITLKKKLKEAIQKSIAKGEKRLFFPIEPAKIVTTAKYLFFDLKCRFVIATALQSRQGFEIYYHFSLDENGLIINLHVVLPVDHPEIESLANDFVAANWIEREIHELFGINFLNHPNPDKLISDGNWAEGVYPYRKEQESN